MFSKELVMIHASQSTRRGFLRQIAGASAVAMGVPSVISAARPGDEKKVAASGRVAIGSVITNKAPYEWRDGAKLHFFKGKYWLLGGWVNGPRKSWNGDDTTNEIWSSADLVSW